MLLYIRVLLTLGWVCGCAPTLSAQPSQHPHRRLFSLGDFCLESGAVLPDAKIAYATYGRLNRDRSNAILLPSAFRGTHHGYDFLIGPGQALDSTRHFIIATEMFANGASSSPSNTPPPFDGPRFPQVSIRDNVAAAHRLLTEALGVRHVKAIVGFSMGAQQAFQWAVSHPDFMDRIVAYCGTAKTYPHAVVMLEGAIRAYQADAAFKEGNYTSPPVKGIAAAQIHGLAWVYSQEWWRRELYKRKFATAEEMMHAWASDTLAVEPNNQISQARTWQRHNVGDRPGFRGDHEAALRSIKAEVLYMPCSTDLYFTIGDIQYESRFIPRVQVVPIPSVWGHFAGVGANPNDNAFINEQIRRFLK